jgi:hypothetical protein
MDRKLLGIYLNDHLAVATAGVEASKRSRGSNAGTPLGDFLDELHDDLEDDRAELEALMSRLGVGKDRVKELAGWTGEKLGRLKLNGRLTSYSPLSRVVELETLLLIVEANAAMWRAMAGALGGEEEEHLRDLATRAKRRATQIERRRVRAVAEALAVEA